MGVRRSRHRPACPDRASAARGNTSAGEKIKAPALLTSVACTLGEWLGAGPHRCIFVRVLQWIPYSYSPENEGNQKESKMYIGGGAILLIIILFLFLR